MRAWAENGLVRSWFYSTDNGEVPILPDEIIHFKEWNHWNELRGVPPLIALSQEIEQDADGRPKWRGPNDGKPGVLDGYPYFEVDILPQAGEILKNKPFAIFMDPRRIKNGNRKGM